MRAVRLCAVFFILYVNISGNAAVVGEDVVLWQDASVFAENSSSRGNRDLRFDAETGLNHVASWPSRTMDDAPASGEYACGGIMATYYSGANFEDGSAACVQLDAHLSFLRVVVARPICTSNYEKFSVRWAGYLRAPATGPLTLRMTVADAGRLYFDRRLVLEAQHHKGFTAVTTTLDVVAGQHYPIVFEYRQDMTGMGVGADLEWSYGGNTRTEAIPSSHLCVAPGRAGQPAAPLQPLLRPSPHNGLPLVSFDGHSFLTYPPQEFDFQHGATLFAVFRFASEDQSKTTSLFEFWGPKTGSVAVQQRADGSQRSPVYRLPMQSFDPSSEFSSHELAVWTFAYLTDHRMAVYKNNHLLEVVPLASPHLPGLSTFNYLGRALGIAAQGPVEIAELMLLRRELSDAERAEVYAGLHAKWFVDRCVDSPCAAGGVCRSTATGFVCEATQETGEIGSEQQQEISDEQQQASTDEKEDQASDGNDGDEEVASEREAADDSADGMPSMPSMPSMPDERKRRDATVRPHQSVQRPSAAGAGGALGESRHEQRQQQEEEKEVEEPVLVLNSASSSRLPSWLSLDTLAAALSSPTVVAAWGLLVLTVFLSSAAVAVWRRRSLPPVRPMQLKLNSARLPSPVRSEAARRERAALMIQAVWWAYRRGRVFLRSPSGHYVNYRPPAVVIPACAQLSPSPSHEALLLGRALSTRSRSFNSVMTTLELAEANRRAALESRLPRRAFSELPFTDSSPLLSREPSNASQAKLDSSSASPDSERRSSSASGRQPSIARLSRQVSQARVLEPLLLLGAELDKPRAMQPARLSDGGASPPGGCSPKTGLHPSG